MLDISDDDDDNNNDQGYQPSGSSKTLATTTKSKSSAMPSSSIVKMSVQQQRSELSKYDDPTEHPSFKRFAQLLDDLLDTYESDLQNLSSRGKSSAGGLLDFGEEIPSEYLLPKQSCSELVQEASKLNSYSILHLIRTDCLFKLQNLLFFNIKDGVRSLHLMNEVQQQKNKQTLFQSLNS